MIVTKRLTLTPPPTSEAPKIVRWLNNKDIMQHSEQRHLTHSIDFQLVYMASMQPPNRYLGIYRDADLIGTISAHMDNHNDVANIGILIGDKTVWGKGFGTEAWQAFSDHLLGNGTRKIEAGCMGLNFGMIHIFRKTGMYYEGRRTAHFVVGDDTTDLVMYGRFQ